MQGTYIKEASAAEDARERKKEIERKINRVRGKKRGEEKEWIQLGRDRQNCGIETTRQNGPNHSTIAKDYTSNTSPANHAAGTLLLNEEYAERERQRVRVCVRKRERERERERVSHPRVLIWSLKHPPCRAERENPNSTSFRCQKVKGRNVQRHWKLRKKRTSLCRWTTLTHGRQERRWRERRWKNRQRKREREEVTKKGNETMTERKWKIGRKNFEPQAERYSYKEKERERKKETAQKKVEEWKKEYWTAQSEWETEKETQRGGEKEKEWHSLSRLGALK